jgi:hypothetical protein
VSEHLHDVVDRPVHLQADDVAELRSRVALPMLQPLPESLGDFASFPEAFEQQREAVATTMGVWIDRSDCGAFGEALMLGEVVDAAVEYLQAQ